MDSLPRPRDPLCNALTCGATDCSQARSDCLVRTLSSRRETRRSTGIQAANNSSAALADRVAHETGIARALNTQAGSDGTYSVRLEQVAFDSLLNWAGELVLRHGVRIVSASIDGSATAGMVSATIVLRAS